MAESFVKKVTVDYDPKGLEEAIRHEERYAQETDKTTRATEKATKAADLQTRAVTGLGSELKSMAAGFVGVTGLLKLYEAFRSELQMSTESMKEQARIARELAEAQLNLAALREEMTPEQVKVLDKIAALSGQSQGEASRMMAELVSGARGLKPEEINQAAVEIAMMRRTSSTPMPELAATFTTMLNEGMSPREANNVLAQAIRDAKIVGASDVGRQIGRVSGEFKTVGGISSIEAAGLAAGSTQLGLAPEPAATSLLNLMRAVRGNGTPEGNSIMRRVGVNREDTLKALQQIGQAVQSGAITRQEMSQFGGDDAMKVMAALGDPDKRTVFFDAINNAIAAGQNPDNLVLQSQNKIFGSNSQLAFNQAMKVMESRIESSQAVNTRAQQQALARKILEETLVKLELEGTVNAAQTKSALGWYDYYASLGMPVEIAADKALQSRTFANYYGTLGGVLNPRWGLDDAQEEMDKRIRAGSIGVIQTSEQEAATVVNNITNQYNGGTSAEEGDSGRRAQP